MIQLKSLTYGYSQDTLIFQDFNLRISHGQSWAILGPSGCGKTTLLYLVAGLRTPISGKVIIEEQEIRRPRPRTGLILQDYGLLPWATVEQNATLGQRIRNFYGPDGKHAPEEQISSSGVNSWLERLGLEAIRNKYPGQISGGQRQRTAIARTLTLNPDLLLMDEPFGSLDAPTREDLQSLTLQLWIEQQLTLIIVTHTIEEAAILGQKILILSKPPNKKSLIIDNPDMIKPDYRDSKQFYDMCRELRLKMGEQ